MIDERYNQGGMVADYIVNELNRPLMGYFARRDGKPSPSPMVRHLRPEGDDHQRVGRLGRRCAAVLLQAAEARTAGRHTHVGRAGGHAEHSRDDRWRRHHRAVARVLRRQRPLGDRERGIAPDVEVEITPADAAAGRDPQLERAVQEAMKLLEKTPPKRVPRPAPVDRHATQAHARPMRIVCERLFIASIAAIALGGVALVGRQPAAPTLTSIEVMIPMRDGARLFTHARSRRLRPAGRPNRCRSSFSGRPTASARATRGGCRDGAGRSCRPTAASSSCRTFAAASSPKARS